MAQRVTDERVVLHQRTQRAVKEWIEAVLSIRLSEDLQASLQNGVILCYLMQEIEERSIPRIQENTTSEWRLKENIHFFLLALADYGIGRHRIFILTDLFDKKNMVSVVECLAELAKVANARGFKPVMRPPEQDTSPIPTLTAEQKKTIKEQISRLKDKPNERTRVKVSAEIVRRKLQVLAGQGIDWPKFEKNLSKFQALVRGHSARRRYQIMVRDVAYRANVAKEILETERNYVNSLSACIKVYMLPLEKEMMAKGGKTWKEDIKVIFSDIQVILHFHETLFSDIEPRVKEWSPRQCLGDIFLKIIAFLKVYTNYLQNFNDSNTRLHTLSKNEKIAKFLGECKQKMTGTKLDLPSLLIMPVQRIPRYNLLLKDLAKHTWPEHPDYESLNESVAKVAQIGDFLNSKKKEADNMAKLLELNDKITKLPLGVILPEPHRRLIEEYSLGPDGKRVLFVFNDLLLIAKNASISLGIVSKKHTTPVGNLTNQANSYTNFKYKDHFFILSVNISELQDDKYPHTLVVERDGHKKATKLLLPTAAAKAVILKEHETLRREVEQLVLEKKRAAQEQRQVTSGQTNEEILQNRKKKAEKRPMSVSGVRPPTSQSQPQPASQLQLQSPKGAPIEKSKTPPSTSPATPPSTPKADQKDKKKKKSGFNLIAGFKAAVSGESSSSSSPASTPPASPSPSTTSVPTLQVPSNSVASSAKSPSTREAKGSPMSERNRPVTLNKSADSLTAGPPVTASLSAPPAGFSVADHAPPPSCDKELPYEVIKQTRSELDQTKLELYLSDVEFEGLFKMNKTEFYKLPQWKRDRLKKTQNLL